MRRRPAAGPRPETSAPLSFAWTAAVLAPASGGAYYPRLLETRAGEVLCAYDTDEGGGPTRVQVSRSLDGGRTWSVLAAVARADVPLANAFLLELPDRAVLAAYRETGRGRPAIRLARSADGGRTWRPGGTVREGRRGLWEPCLLLRDDGRVLCACASEEEAPRFPQVIEVHVSADAGATWRPLAVAARSPRSRDGVPSLVEGLRGELLCFFEATDAGPPFAIRLARSADGGASWSGRELLHAPPDAARRACAPSAVRLRDGRLLCAFYSDEAAARPGDRHTDVRWTASTDGGATWGGAAVLPAAPAPARWATFLELLSGRLIAASFTAEGGRPRIVAAGTGEPP